MNRIVAAFLLIALSIAFPAVSRAVEADANLGKFTFASGESLDQLRIHYRAFGKPERDRRQGPQRRAHPARHDGQRRSVHERDLRRRAVRARAAARHDALLRRAAGRDRPRAVEQAERRAARAVPALRLRGHGRGAAPSADGGAQGRSPATRHGHVDGRDAHLAVGRALPRLHGRAACRWRACRCRSPAAIASGDAWSSTPSATIRRGTAASTRSSRRACAPPRRCCGS